MLRVSPASQCVESGDPGKPGSPHCVLDTRLHGDREPRCLGVRLGSQHRPFCGTLGSDFISPGYYLFLL